MSSVFIPLPVEDGGSPGTVDSFNGRTGVVVSQSGDYTASQITNVPSGTIAATNVQSALNELDSEKQPTGNYITALTGDVTATGPGSVAATLANSGVSAGSYIAADITVDAKGRVTAAASNSGSVNFVTKTASYTILATDRIIYVDSSGGAFTLTLPDPTTVSSATKTQSFRIIDSTGSLAANNVTLARFSGEKIEGLAASKVLQTAWGSFLITTNNVDWFVS